MISQHDVGRSFTSVFPALCVLLVQFHLSQFFRLELPSSRVRPFENGRGAVSLKNTTARTGTRIHQGFLIVIFFCNSSSLWHKITCKKKFNPLFSCSINFHKKLTLPGQKIRQTLPQLPPPHFYPHHNANNFITAMLLKNEWHRQHNH